MTGLDPAIRRKPGDERSSGNPVIETDPNLHTTLNSDELATLVKSYLRKLLILDGDLRILKICGRIWRENWNLYMGGTRRIY